MDEQLKIVYRNYGVADRFPDGVIELNKHLKKWPDLHKSLVQHEARHTNNIKFNRKDLVHDIGTPNQINTWRLTKFMIRHPFSFIQFMPIYWTKKRGLIIDYNLIVIWTIFSVVIFSGLLIGNVI